MRADKELMRDRVLRALQFGALTGVQLNARLHTSTASHAARELAKDGRVLRRVEPPYVIYALPERTR